MGLRERTKSPMFKPLKWAGERIGMREEAETLLHEAGFPMCSWRRSLLFLSLVCLTGYYLYRGAVWLLGWALYLAAA